MSFAAQVFIFQIKFRFRLRFSSQLLSDLIMPAAMTKVCLSFSVSEVIILKLLSKNLCKT